MNVSTCLIAVALTGSVAAQETPGPVPAGPQPPGMSPAVQTCVPCHGTRGEGKPTAGFPRIAAQSPSYIRKQLDSYADGSRRDPVMEPIAKGLPPGLRAEVAAYYAQVDGPALSSASVLTKSWQDRGRLLANHGDLTSRVQACVNCHGPAGVGQPPALPYLAGLHDGYIRATLIAWQDGRRRNDAGQQMALIAKGLRAGGHRCGSALLRRVDATEIRAVEPGAGGPATVGACRHDALDHSGHRHAAVTGVGIESGAPSTGGEHGIAAGGARSPGGADDRATASSGARMPTGTRPSAEDAAQGRALIGSGAHGCAACHAIPGIRAPRGIVGPDLTGFARRPFIAGQFPNTPEVLVAFLQNSPALVAKTGMPNLGLTLEEARRIAAYLYTMEPWDGR